MKITKRQLRRLIREAMQPMTSDYVMNSLAGGKSARTGESFMDIALGSLQRKDYRGAANAIMDALMIDDTPVGAEEELQDLISLPGLTPEELVDIAADWGSRHFRGPR